MAACPDGERLSAYLDGELRGAEAQAVEAHLADCQACADEVAALRAVDELVAGVEAPAVSDEEWGTAWDAIAARSGLAAPRPRRRWTALRTLLVPVAAAALLAFAVGFWALTSYNVAEAHDCVVEYVETAEGYSSSYYHSDEADVTIITLVPAEAEEATPSDASRDTP